MTSVATRRSWPLHLDGHAVAAGDRALIEVVDPATGDVVADVPVATDADIDRALAAAARVQPAWAATDAWTRSRIVRDAGRALAARADEAAEVLCREQGKPLREARAEVMYAVETFDWYADEARRLYGRLIPGHRTDARLTVTHEPVGPVAAFTPWNFPIVTPARKVAAALAAGCTVILKPAEDTPGAAQFLVDALAEAGLPAGALNLVTGVPADISRRLIASDVIRKVSLTGSVPVGQELMRLCAEGIKVPTLELGGHAAVLVLDDCDLDLAVAGCVEAKFRNAGQVCVAPSRFYVQDAIHDEFVERFVAATRKIRVGHGLDPETDMGPLVSARRRDAVEAHVADAVARGATVHCGGERVEGDGFFFAPTVLTGVTTEMSLMVDEPFGPLAPILRFGDLEEGLAAANATEFGLAGYAFTRSLRAADRVSSGLEVGIVGINTCLTSTVEAPFGGVKRSGLGLENGVEGIEAYTVAKYTQTVL